MSYQAMGELIETDQVYDGSAGYGSYFTFQPHEIYPTSGMGAFGAAEIDFSAARVWGNIEKSNQCYKPGGIHYGKCPAEPKVCGPCNYAGSQAMREIQRGLNKLGYGPMVVDGRIEPTATEFKKFLRKQNLAPGAGFGFSKEGVFAMEDALKKRGFLAGLGAGGLLLLAAVVGGIGYTVYKGRKKRGGGDITRF